MESAHSVLQRSHLCPVKLKAATSVLLRFDSAYREDRTEREVSGVSDTGRRLALYVPAWE